MLVLASNSPRRKQLLKTIAADFLIIPSLYDEKQNGLSPIAYAKDCAYKKAEEVFSRIKNDYSDLIVLAADTIVVLDNKICGKPKDHADARKMLSALSNNKHYVITGICIKTNKKVLINYEKSKLVFDSLSQKEIDEYIKTGSPLDKAGAYGIQDKQIYAKTKSIKGNIDNIMGLPTRLVEKLLKKV